MRLTHTTPAVVGIGQGRGHIDHRARVGPPTEGRANGRPVPRKPLEKVRDGVDVALQDDGHLPGEHRIVAEEGGHSVAEQREHEDQVGAAPWPRPTPRRPPPSAPTAPPSPRTATTQAVVERQRVTPANSLASCRARRRRGPAPSRGQMGGERRSIAAGRLRTMGTRISTNGGSWSATAPRFRAACRQRPRPPLGAEETRWSSQGSQEAGPCGQASAVAFGQQHGGRGGVSPSQDRRRANASASFGANAWFQASRAAGPRGRARPPA